MHVGAVVAERFEIVEEAGAGGMGRVFRAIDHVEGNDVALKVLSRVGFGNADRFAREAVVLAALRHPAIVRYVAHGATSDGTPYIAMEWIDGEPLSFRLARAPLALSDSIALVRRVTEGLAAAHAAGVIHRDVKPSNILLPGGDVTRAKLVDFGIARRAQEEVDVTASGMVVGTWAYISPEQALGAGDPDPRSDLFSLGCVLYECITGNRAFRAKDATAVLAKILLDEPPNIENERSDVPPDIAMLVGRLMSKTPDGRPASAAALLGEIDRVGTVTSTDSPRTPPPPALTGKEQRVVWIVLAQSALDFDATQVATGTTRGPSREAALRAAVESQGGRLEGLANGVAIGVFSGSGVPTDEAPRAARCALAMHALLPDAPMALALGRGVVSGRTPVGDVIDEGVSALNVARPGEIRLVGIDEALLGARFAVAHAPGGAPLLVSEQADVDTSRKLLGRATSCVGRERELGTLEALYEECASEPVARAALVVGPAGAGKSRIRYELIERLRRNGAELEVLVGRGDSVGAGSPFALLAGAIRQAADILDGEPLETQRHKLAQRVSGALSGDERLVTRTIELLGELCRVPFPDGGSPMLRAARRDATLMGDAMRTAFEDWLGAECLRRPVLLVLEDLHWGDLPTVRFVDAALRNLRERPLLVLGLARPDVHALFPNIWKERHVVEVSLAPLTRKASEKLVREVLGDETPRDVTERIVVRAEGNAFYLEELIRAVSSGVGDTLPSSVLGTVQTRLGALDSSARRVLRAASVFGERFWRGGVMALVGGPGTFDGVSEQLERLSQLEIVTRRATASVPGEIEYVFRHSLVRESTYAMLTDDDRKLGHKLAGDWLERVGEHDAAVLAEHFDRGQAPERASRWLARAAEQALGGNDLARALELADRAARFAPENDRGEIQLVQAEAYRWQGDYKEGIRHAELAVGALLPGSVQWFLAVGELIASCAHGGDFERAEPFLADAIEIECVDRAKSAQVMCVSRGCTQLLELGRYDDADRMIARVLAPVASEEELETRTRGWLAWLRAMRALCEGDLGTFVPHTERGLAFFEVVGDLRNATSQRTNVGYARAELGDYAGAEEVLRHVLASAERMALPMIVAYALQNLANVVSRLGRHEEALALAEQSVERAVPLTNPRIEGAARFCLAQLALAAGDAARAERESRLAIGLLGAQPPMLGVARATLSRSLLAAGRAPEALEEARLAMETLESHGGFEEGESLVRIAWIEALEALGDFARASEASKRAEARLDERSKRISDPTWRTSFLERVEESRRIRALRARLAP